MRRIKQVLLLFAAALPSLSADAANTDARLVLSHDSAPPGATVMAGLHLKMKPGWHTYWQNGGDSGAPTTIDWTLPKGITAGEILWPVPEKYEAEGLFTFVYHDDVVLLVPLKLAADVSPGKLELKAKAAWLECEKLCLPGGADVDASLTVGESKPSKDAAILDTWKGKLPIAKTNLDARAAWAAPAKDDSRPLLIEWTTVKQAKEADFFPYANEKFTVSAGTDSAKATGGEAAVRKTVTNLSGWPEEIAGVLIERGDDGKLPGAYEVKLPIRASLDAPRERTKSKALGPGIKKHLLVQLASAFLGGLILNLMPCVLPVLALKVLSVVRQTQESPGRVRVLGTMYGIGVIVSFQVLAVILIAVKQAGGVASWGMQFQNPQFLVVMTTFLTLMALNLFGVFEITLGSGAMGAASELASKEGVSGAFFNGVVAVVLGTSCTAPVLGAALGYAITQTPLVIVLTFMAVGAGLAFPYVALSFFPALRRFLPKPGVWMERFKVALGFPVMAVAVWLLSQMPTHFGKGGALWMGLFLITVSVAAWIFGQFVQRGAQRKGLALGIAALLLLAGYVVALERELDWRSPADSDTPERVVKRDPNGIDWQPWSQEAVDKALAEGRPVFVDFTADWCLNCQANKRTSIEIPSVRKRLKEINAVSLLGDFTKKSKVIAAELQRFNRAGVPLVLVYPKDPSKEPLVLPELLTPSIVLDALNEAVK